MSQTPQPPPIPSLPPPEFPCECEALFDCAADTENEISFSKGDIVIIIAKPYPDWWMAKSDSKEGLVPANYLKPILKLPAPSASPFAASASPGSRPPIGNSSSRGSLPLTGARTTVVPAPTAFMSAASVGTPQLVMLPTSRGGGSTAKGSDTPPRLVGRLSQTHLAGLNNAPASPPPASSSPKPKLLLALYDCDPDDADELRLKAGDNIILLEKRFPDWWYGEHSLNKSRGIFPSNYVQEILEVVRALHEFQPQSPDELQFPKGAIIHVESYLDADWRYGSYGGRRGIFPVSWTEPYDPCAPAPPTSTPSSPPSQPSISSLPPASSSTKLPPPAATAPPKKPSLFSRAKKPKKDKSNKPKPEKDMGFSDIAGQDQLIRIMTSPDLTLVKAVLGMCEIREKDRMAMCLVHLFELNGTTPHLVKTLIEQEIQETQPGTSAAASLFRGNSVATKILTAYSLITGTEYLKKTLKPLLSSVVYSSGGFEIDPNRLGPADSVKDNVQNLLAVVTMFTSKIMRSVDAVPFHLRKVLAHLSAVIRLKFPDAEVAVLGSFFFLRFICPTIISPLESGIWTDKIPPHSARCLVLISKTLQNLANGVLFGQKEPFMEPLNPFIQEHIPQVKTFYEGLTSNIDEDTTAIAAASGSVLKRDPEVFAHLHEVLAERLDIIRTHVERNHFSNLEKVELLESFLRDQQLIS